MGWGLWELLLSTIKTKLKELSAAIGKLSPAAFRYPLLKSELRQDVRSVGLIVEWRHYDAALHILQTGIMPKFDGCRETGSAGRDDWIENCETQTQLYWAMNEIATLLRIF